VQQCAAGLVPIGLDDEAPGLWLRLPQARTSPIDHASRAELERIVGAPLSAAPRLIDVGPRWIVARHSDATALLALTPDLAALAALSLRLGATGLTLFAPGSSEGRASDQAPGQPREARQPDGPEPSFEVRSWAPAHGVPEDPVCGSGNGCVAVYLAGDGLTAPYRARQGRAIGRDGHIRIRYHGTDIEVGGDAVVCVRGQLLA
jgi:PhzF family phenazine biosynthesis protein